jgi:hypothetical protein
MRGGMNEIGSPTGDFVLGAIIAVLGLLILFR